MHSHLGSQHADHRAFAAENIVHSMGYPPIEDNHRFQEEILDILIDEHDRANQLAVLIPKCLGGAARTFWASELTPEERGISEAEGPKGILKVLPQNFALQRAGDQKSFKKTRFFLKDMLEDPSKLVQSQFFQRKIRNFKALGDIDTDDNDWGSGLHGVWSDLSLEFQQYINLKESDEEDFPTLPAYLRYVRNKTLTLVGILFHTKSAILPMETLTKTQKVLHSSNHCTKELALTLLLLTICNSLHTTLVPTQQL